jgi:hypothetical protein
MRRTAPVQRPKPEPAEILICLTSNSSFFDEPR